MPRRKSVEDTPEPPVTGVHDCAGLPVVIVAAIALAVAVMFGISWYRSDPGAGAIEAVKVLAEAQGYRVQYSPERTITEPGQWYAFKVPQDCPTGNACYYFYSPDNGITIHPGVQ